MKVFILVDDEKIVRCLASERANLHKNKLHMALYHVECRGYVGDEYDAVTDRWTPRPENWPKPDKTPAKKLAERLEEALSLEERVEIISQYLIDPTGGLK